jgi:hypothetical protein
VAEEVQMTEQLVEAQPVRPLPVRAESRTIEIWGREFSPLAVAAGGAAAGVAAVAVARAARSPRAGRRAPRRGLFRRREKVVSSRSFLVDVHVLGR